MSALALAQAPRLVDCIEAPFAYLHCDAADDTAPARVRELLAHPALDAVVAGPAESGAARSLALVRGLLQRGAGEFELALTGILARAGEPLLILRVTLSDDQAANLRRMLAADVPEAVAPGGEGAAPLATPHRQLGAHRTYRLASNRPAGERSPVDGAPTSRGPAATDAGPGQLVELALVGRDLVIGNDGSAMGELLQPTGRTTAEASTRPVLAVDPRFRSLHERIAAPKGSLLLFADWQRLGRRLESSAEGVFGALLQGSGLAAARSLMVSIAPEKTDFVATLLIDLSLDDPPLGDRERVDGRGALDGWIAAVQPAPVRSLVAELPRGGLGGLVLSVDLAAVAAHSPRSSHMVWDLREAFEDFGLDFDRNVLGRLGSRGTVQLHFSEPAAGGTGVVDAGAVPVAAVRPVYALRAKSRKAAQDLLLDLRRVAEGAQLGRVLPLSDKRQPEVLELGGQAHAFSAFVTLQDDSVLLAEDAATLLLVHDELRRGARVRKRDTVAAGTLKAVAGERVAGLFDVDLQPLCARLAVALGGVDFSGLPMRHVGCLEFHQSRADATAVVSVSVLSSR